MQKEYDMTEADIAELAEIDADRSAVRLRRVRFFAKLRQREYRKRTAAIKATGAPL